MTVEPHQSASPNGMRSTPVGAKPTAAKTKQTVAMIRKTLLTLMAAPPGFRGHSSSFPISTPRARARRSDVESRQEAVLAKGKDCRERGLAVNEADRAQAPIRSSTLDEEVDSRLDDLAVVVHD
jgi:hypothetical protein